MLSEAGDDNLDDPPTDQLILVEASATSRPLLYLLLGFSSLDTIYLDLDDAAQ